MQLALFQVLEIKGKLLNGCGNPLRETSKSNEEIRENTFKTTQIYVYVYK